MNYQKWIEQFLKESGKFIKNNKQGIIWGSAATVGTAIFSSMLWAPQVEKAKIEGDKQGFQRASEMYSKKFHEQEERINKLEEKVILPSAASQELLDEVLEEYEFAIRKILKMQEKEIQRLENISSKTKEETEYMKQVVNEYAKYKLKLFGADSKSEVYFVIGNIAYLDVDCIVTAANQQLKGGGGVDGAVHEAAGEGLLRECKRLNGCNVGDAKITDGYNLHAKYVIHTVGPVYSGKKQDELDLANCYLKSLELAKKNNVRSIAFPAISTGRYGYPLKEASEIALGTITKWLMENEDYPLAVLMCSYDETAYMGYRNIWKDIITREETNDVAEENANLKGLGFSIIHKYCDVMMDGEKGVLVWDYFLHNEISFANIKKKETKSLFTSRSDDETQVEFERLAKKYALSQNEK